MRRWLLRLGVLGAGAAMSAASAPTLSAWVHTTSNPSGTVSAVPDWVAPTASRLVLQKGPSAGVTERGMSGYVRPGGTYRICSKFADTGNPASNLKDASIASIASLTANVSDGALNALVAGSSWCPSTDDRESATLSVDAGVTNGTKTFTVQVRDNALNARTQTGSVEVDGTPPTAMSFTTANKVNGTVSHPETGDTMTFTFSEPMDPASIIPGWDGSGQRTIRTHFSDQGGQKDDRITLTNTANQRIPLANTAAASWIDTRQNIANGDFYFTSTLEVSGNSFVVTFGAASTAPAAPPTRTDGNTAAATWPTSDKLFDRAGNLLTAGSVTQPVAGAKAEF